MDDIVYLLRGHARFALPSDPDDLETQVVCSMAADEIERLRAERDGWKARALELDALYVKEHGHG